MSPDQASAAGVAEHMDTVRTELSEAEKAALAAANAQTALNADQELSRLKSAAGKLGKTLIDTAADDTLWNALSREAPATLTDTQRAQLATVTGMNWQTLLPAIGYKPPPEVTKYGPEFVNALADAIAVRDGQNINEIRGKTKELGQSLVALTVLPTANRSWIRRMLRKGARVAGAIAVAAGVAGAAILITHALLPAGVAATVAAAITSVIPGNLFPVEVVLEAVKEMATKAVEVTLELALGRERHDKDEKSEDEEARSQRATNAIDQVPEAALTDLRDRWATLGAHAQTQELVASSSSTLTTAKGNVHIAAVIASGASWSSARLSDRLTAILVVLTTTDIAVGKQPPDAKLVSTSLAAVVKLISEVREEIRQAAG